MTMGGLTTVRFTDKTAPSWLAVSIASPGARASIETSSEKDSDNSSGVKPILTFAISGFETSQAATTRFPAGERVVARSQSPGQRVKLLRIQKVG